MTIVSLGVRPQDALRNSVMHCLGSAVFPRVCVSRGKYRQKAFEQMCF